MKPKKKGTKQVVYKYAWKDLQKMRFSVVEDSLDKEFGPSKRRTDPCRTYKVPFK